MSLPELPHPQLMNLPNINTKFHFHDPLSEELKTYSNNMIILTNLNCAEIEYFVSLAIDFEKQRVKPFVNKFKKYEKIFVYLSTNKICDDYLKALDNHLDEIESIFHELSKGPFLDESVQAYSGEQMMKVFKKKLI